jgi:hypothetical protein
VFEHGVPPLNLQRASGFPLKSSRASETSRRLFEELRKSTEAGSYNSLAAEAPLEQSVNATSGPGNRW